MQKALQPHYELTGKIIGVYYDVYNGLGRTYPEYIYESAMMGDLLAKGLRCRRQPEYKITYKERVVGAQRLDLFVTEEVVVELKVTPKLTRLHKAQGISYLKVTGCNVGLLCNFGGAEPEFGRLYFEERPSSEALQQPGSWPDDLLHPELTYEVIGALFEVHSVLGPGFIYRIYGNALYHELQLRGLSVRPRRIYEVIYRERAVGKIKFDHLQIEDCLMVFPVAMQNIDELSINNLKAWLKHCNISLGIIANFYPTRLEYMVLRP